MSRLSRRRTSDFLDGAVSKGQLQVNRAVRSNVCTRSRSYNCDFVSKRCTWWRLAWSRGPVADMSSREIQWILGEVGSHFLRHRSSSREQTPTSREVNRLLMQPHTCWAKGPRLLVASIIWLSEGGISGAMPVDWVISARPGGPGGAGAAFAGAAFTLLTRFDWPFGVRQGRGSRIARSFGGPCTLWNMDYPVLRGLQCAAPRVPRSGRPAP